MSGGGRGSVSKQQFRLPISTILNNPIGRHHLKKFVLKEHSEENLMFWYDVEKFRKVDNPQDLLLQGQRIWNEYLRPEAPLQLTLDADTYDQVEDDVKHQRFTPFMYNDAQNAVHEVLKQDIHIRFVGSPEYNRMWDQLAAKLHRARIKMNGKLSLKKCLENPISAEAIRQFMERSGQDEHLQALLSLALFRTRPMEKKERKKEARYILKRFFAPESKQRIPMKQEEYDRLQALLDIGSKSTDEIKEGLFDSVYHSLVREMQDEVFPAFLRSDLSEMMLREMEFKSREEDRRIAALQGEKGADNANVRRYSVSNSASSGADKTVTMSMSEFKSMDGGGVTVPSVHNSHNSGSGSRHDDIPRLTMLEIFSDWELLHAFIQFSRKEHSEENILFWTEVREFNALPPEKQKERAEAIFRTYLKPGAQYQIPIDSENINGTAEAIRDGRLLNVFKDAADFVFTTMHNDAYYRFLKSEFYRDVLAARREEEKAVGCCGAVCPRGKKQAPTKKR